MDNTTHRKTFYEPQLYCDHFQNFKSYGIPKAQLIIADVPYNLGKNAYASSPEWYVGGDNKNGESNKAGKAFFESDYDFSPEHFMIFCSRLLKDDKKQKGEKSNAPALILFLPFEALHQYIEIAKSHGLNHYIPLIFRKKYSPQVLKANMKIVGNCEYGLVLYKDRLPKFNNDGQMIFNCFDWREDYKNIPKIHPTQKPVPLLESLITIFTDPGDVVIDPCAGSGSTLKAAANLGRRAYGFEIKKDFVKEAKEKMLSSFEQHLFV
jgi:site-specific DNA-methyltransferase (adenine-specific)